MKNSTTTQIIAKEGWKYIFFLFIAFLCSLVFHLFPWVFLLLLFFSAYLFRNPERLPAEDDDMAVLSPCDGNIVSISKSSYLGKEYIKVEIEKNLLQASILRAPTLLNIAQTKRRHGLILSDSVLREKLGERVSIDCNSKYNELFLNITAGIFARKIELFKTVGPLKSAQRFGILVDGTIELYLALDTRIKVSVGDEVRAGESVLGYFAHQGEINDK